MTEVLQTLIDKQDSFEIVRDQIALILATEVSNQMSLAAAATLDPLLWKLRIFTERSNPWSQFQERDIDDESPIVNVWYDSSTFPGPKGNTVSRQQGEVRYNLDIIAVGVSKDDAAGGHTAGDKEAALNLARAIRLVRNILMSGPNTYLQLQGTIVGQRWPESITQFQPDGENAKNMAAARLILRVDLNEFSPQYVGEELEEIHVDVHRAEDGEIVIAADYEAPFAP